MIVSMTHAGIDYSLIYDKSSHHFTCDNDTNHVPIKTHISNPDHGQFSRKTFPIRH